MSVINILADSANAAGHALDQEQVVDESAYKSKLKEQQLRLIKLS